MMQETKNLTHAVIKKRNEEVVPFDEQRITKAIEKAMMAAGRNDLSMASEITAMALKHLSSNIDYEEIPSIEKVQDSVEWALFEAKLFDTAKKYILYRERRSSIRSTKGIFENIELVDKYLNLQDWRIKESANSSYSLQGLNQHVSTIISSQYWLDKIYPAEVGEAHKSGKMHVHDLGFLSVYCVGWDLKDLLMSGFKGVDGKNTAGPAKHFRTALGQIVNFFYTMQGEAAGAQAFSNFDTYLAPFIRHDSLDYEQVKQAIQEFIFNLNVPTRVGFQTPFTNITLDLNIPDFLKDEAVVIGGEMQESTYGEYQKEMDIFNKAFSEVLSEGDANGAVFSFPIPTYNITKDFDWDNPAYKYIWEITSKYGIPYFSNFVNSDMSPDDVRSMCCRLRLDKRELNKRGGGLFGANPLTGSVGVVTINLPRIGYEAKNEKEFFAQLSDLMHKASISLEIKRKTIEELTERGLFPYSKFYLRHLKGKNGKFWQNHFATVGIVGMNECLHNFMGTSITDVKGAAFAEKVLDFMRDKLAEFQEETGNNYNLEATPAEGTSYRLARIDKTYHPDIISAGDLTSAENAVPYYTNSTQPPVGHTDDIFEALRHQDPLQTKYTGGTVFHVFVGEKQLPVESIKAFLKKVTSNFKMPYITLSPSFSICPNHGYVYGEHQTCPKCAETGKTVSCDVYSRIVGYLRPVNQWNDGKAAEFNERKLYDSKIMPLNKSDEMAKYRKECLLNTVKEKQVVQEADTKIVEDYKVENILN